MNFHKRHYQQKTRSRPGQGNSVLRSFYENLLNESQKIERSLTKAYYVLFRKTPKETAESVLGFFASSDQQVESEIIQT